MSVQSWAALKYPPTTKTKHRIWHFIERHLPNIALLLMVAALMAAILYPAMVYVVPSGHTGVLWKRFGGGTVLRETRVSEEGFHLVFPWDKVFIYDLRLQSANETYNAISKDGINLNASITIRFQLRREGVPYLHQSIGPDYLRLLLLPEVGNRVRQVIALYPAEQVYSVERQKIQDEMQKRVQDKLGSNLPGIGRFRPGQTRESSMNIYDLLVLGIDLPPAVIAAINRKADQFYISEEYDFRLRREEKEALRKQIEARGVRDFQDTVARGITDSYLRWRGIEATLQLSQSPNSKVVIIGSNKDGLPIILGNVDGPVNPAPPSSTPPVSPPQSPALPPNSPQSRPSPEAAANTAPSPASAALSAGSPDIAGTALQSPPAVASEIRQAAKPPTVNTPQEVTPAANLSTPSAATPEVPHAFSPPMAPAARQNSQSGAIHPSVPDTSPPERISPEDRINSPPR